VVVVVGANDVVTGREEAARSPIYECVLDGEGRVVIGLQAEPGRGLPPASDNGAYYGDKTLDALRDARTHGQATAALKE